MFLKFIVKVPPQTFKNKLKISGHPTHEKNVAPSSDDSEVQNTQKAIPAHRMYEKFEITF
jgi:hypothetical protein